MNRSAVERDAATTASFLSPWDVMAFGMVSHALRTKLDLEQTRACWNNTGEFSQPSA